MALNAKPDRSNSGCCLALLSTVTQIRYDISGRKPAQTRQKNISGGFLGGSSRPKHNHEPQTDTAKHQRALIPTRRKLAFSAGGSVHRPFSSESAVRASDCAAAWSRCHPRAGLCCAAYNVRGLTRPKIGVAWLVLCREPRRGARENQNATDYRGR